MYYVWTCIARHQVVFFFYTFFKTSERLYSLKWLRDTADDMIRTRLMQLSWTHAKRIILEELTSEPKNVQFNYHTHDQ